MARRTRGRTSIGAALALGVTVCGTSAAANVEGVRLWSGPERTRVVLDVSAPVDHRLFTLEDPARVVVDLPGVEWGKDAPLPDASGVVRGIRRGERPGGQLRIVLDLGAAVQPSSFLVKPNEVYGDRLVIDLVAPEVRSAAPVRSMRDEGSRDLVIAIDAGHGGEDPGAIGSRGTREKDVVLAIARELARLVDAEPGMRAVMIRDGDYSVSLRRRMAIAREQRADMFVSIHADAFKDKRAHGSSVYVLSARGATSEAARWLAERENAADLVGGVSLDDKDEVLASVLLDLSQTATISASLKAGEHVRAQLDGVVGVRKDDVQQAGFLVLKSPDIPSILVETAFISNPAEERRLRSPSDQRLWAHAIMTGVRNYFLESPLPGTRLADAGSQAAPMTYVIARGDTLSGIANRFAVSLRSLRSANGLRGDGIRIGQTLTIPLSGS